MTHTIQIAPTAEQIVVTDTAIHTNWNGGITYTAEGLNRYTADYLKESFAMAIALCSKRWQVQDLLNAHLHLNGIIE